MAIRSRVRRSKRLPNWFIWWILWTGYWIVLCLAVAFIVANIIEEGL